MEVFGGNACQPVKSYYCCKPYLLDTVARISYNMFTANRKACTTCNCNCRIEAEGLLKVTGTVKVICRKLCKILTSLQTGD